jgi:hypothetical protein
MKKTKIAIVLFELGASRNRRAEAAHTTATWWFAQRARKVTNCCVCVPAP